MPAAVMCGQRGHHGEGFAAPFFGVRGDDPPGSRLDKVNSRLANEDAEGRFFAVIVNTSQSPLLSHL